MVAAVRQHQSLRTVARRFGVSTSTVVYWVQRSDGNHTLWESLGTFTVGGDGKLTVTLSDQANGNVVADGVRVVFQGPAAALLAAGGTAAVHPDTATLAATDLGPVVEEAIARWQATGLSAGQAAALRAVNVQVADLGGAYLGMAADRTIWLDDNAASWGWFVDKTPWSDSEFTTLGDQGRMDLLTVLSHEMGHLLGLEHSSKSGDVMDAALNLGVRLMPAASDLLGSTLADRGGSNGGSASWQQVGHTETVGLDPAPLGSAGPRLLSAPLATSHRAITTVGSAF